MPMVGSSTDDGAGGEPRPAGPAVRGYRLLWRLGWSTVAAGVAVVLLLGLGFLWFIGRVPGDEVALSRSADGIVALTGGPSRVADAMELMAAGRGRRLLRDGHNPVGRCGVRLRAKHARGCRANGDGLDLSRPFIFWNFDWHNDSPFQVCRCERTLRSNLMER
jgi:hypothetical protein